MNDWMEGMIIDCYEDLYRFKGVLAIKGWPDRFIFQASLPHWLDSTSAQFHPAQTACTVLSLLMHMPVGRLT